MSEHPALASEIDRLTADHLKIDPLLERGDEAFAALPSAEAAVAVVAELAALLDDHLTREEGIIIAPLREARAFPPPANDDEANLYAEGFAWSSHGIAARVLTQLDEILPEALGTRLPAARRAFAVRCERAWGTADEGASLTSVPEPGRIG